MLLPIIPGPSSPPVGPGYTVNIDTAKQEWSNNLPNRPTSRSQSYEGKTTTPALAGYTVEYPLAGEEIVFVHREGRMKREGDLG
jgi:hypothetical protein